MNKNLNENQIKELKECFKSFDKDGSGYISASELGSVCEALGLVVSEGDLTHLLKLMDTDGSGCVDFKEFKIIMMEQFYKQPSEEELEQAFEFFDQDNSGFITESELYQVMTRFRGGVTKEEITNMVNNCDKDSDGKINKREFIKIIMDC